jgi:hypothetical protein
MTTAPLGLLRVKGGKADCGHEDLAHHDHLGFRAGRVHLCFALIVEAIRGVNTPSLVGLMNCRPLVLMQVPP